MMVEVLIQFKYKQIALISDLNLLYVPNVRPIY